MWSVGGGGGGGGGKGNHNDFTKIGQKCLKSDNFNSCSLIWVYIAV